MNTQEELHIASLVVHATATQVDAVAAAIAQMPVAQVHATTSTGKIIVTIESLSGDEMTITVGAIQQMSGVLSAMLVYQCVDSLEDMNQEMLNAQA